MKTTIMEELSEECKKYSCQIKRFPPRSCLSIKTRTPVQELPKHLKREFPTIYKYIQQQGGIAEEYPFVLYKNMDMSKLDIEIGVPTSKPMLGIGKIQQCQIPDGDHGIALFTGAYDKIEPAYNALSEFIKKQGREATGHAYEFYTSPPETPPEQIKTWIMFPLK